MNILITGPTGLVGRRAVEMACSNNYNVKTYGRSRPLSYIDGSHYYKPNELCSDVDIILHCASATPFNAPLHLCKSINEEIDAELTQLIRNIKPAHVIYLSTMAVYGDIQSSVVDEQYTPLNPNCYGASKLEGEILLRETCKEVSVRLTILRLPGVVDTNMHDIFFKRCYDALYSGQTIRVRSTIAGFNNAVLADDVFNTAVKVVRDETTGVINLHSYDTLSLADLFGLLTKKTGRDVKVVFDESCNPSFIIANSAFSLVSCSTLSDIVSVYHERRYCECRCD
jgi:nucleoside-diphosphate-sugar epimerase